MAKMVDANPKNTTGGYERVCGKEIANLISKIQSTNIRNGVELETIIGDVCGKKVIKDMIQFHQKMRKLPNGVYVCTKKTLNRKEYFPEGIEPDFLIFEIKGRRIKCTVVELKDGFNFDTAKSPSEARLVNECVNFLKKKMKISVRGVLCSFSQENKRTIVNGLKHAFSQQEVMTGTEICNLLGISYKKIQRIRQRDVEENQEYIFEEILKMKEFKKFCKKQNIHIA